MLAAAQQDADAPRWTSKELQKDGRSCWLLTNKDKHVDVEVCTQENKASEIKSQSTNPTCVHTLHTSPRSGPGPGIAIPHVPGLARPLAVLQCYGVKSFVECVVYCGINPVPLSSIHPPQSHCPAPKSPHYPPKCAPLTSAAPPPATAAPNRSCSRALSPRPCNRAPVSAKAP